MPFIKKAITFLCITIIFTLSESHSVASAQPTNIHHSQSFISIALSMSQATISPQMAIERLLTTTEVKEEWFTPVFAKQVPPSQVQAIITSLKAELGAYQSVQADGSDYQIVFEKGIVPTKIVLTPDGQIAGLLFQPPLIKAANLEEAIAGFKTLPGQVSLLVVENGSEKAAFNADKPLAVGSTFKLAVLQALQDQIASRKKSWRDVVELQPEWKSLPSGILQNWADGSLLTLQTLASLMISLSDNTATDSLIHLVGRADIEAISPRNRPFLTTREAFVLKGSQNQDLLKRYRVADTTQRRSLLTEAAKTPLPNVSEFEANPVALDVEWFFTTQELCNLMEQVKDLPLMSINPGVAKAEDWQQVAFKGGSEPGVLNLTTWLKAKNDKTYCVSATWNHNTPLEEVRFLGLYSGVLEVLKR
jgi:beta-lactamase class A